MANLSLEITRLELCVSTLVTLDYFTSDFTKRWISACFCEDIPMIRINYAVLTLLGSLLLSADISVSAPAEPTTGQTLNPIMLSNGGNESQVAVVKWAAFGSGCRSVEEMASKDRNVIFTIHPKNAIQTSKLTFDLVFPEYSLQSGKQVDKDNALEFYSECALRFAIRGQPGRRVKKIEGLVKLELQKDKGASLMVFNELRFGQFGSDERKLDYDEQTEIKKTVIDVNLVKDLSAVRSDGQSSCGTDQVLFYDFTMYAKKTRKASQVSASFQAPKRASVRLEFENCTAT
jgi:hypothetical protein